MNRTKMLRPRLNDWKALFGLETLYKDELAPIMNRINLFGFPMFCQPLYVVVVNRNENLVMVEKLLVT